MKRLHRYAAILILCLSTVVPARAFSLLGPYLPWQLAAYDGFNIGYNLVGDIGGPQTPLGFFRWNIPVVTYAFDESFIRYFGVNGMREVEKAFAILNAIPEASSITNDGARLYINDEPVPFHTKRINYEARAAGLLDLKSFTMQALLEEIGLAQPERWVYTLRSRAVRAQNTITNWSTIIMNYDPITLGPTNKVNGVTYTYEIFESMIAGGVPPNLSEAEDLPIDANAIFPFSSVASHMLGSGEFYTGLTHDDVGGLRYLLDPTNIVTETFLPGVLPSNFLNSPWYPVFTGTNATGTNIVNPSQVVTQAMRGGVNQIQFKRVNFDSLTGQTFTPLTFSYTDFFVNPTNGKSFKLKMQRTIQTPDIVFVTGDLGLTLAGSPFLFARTSTAGWINNDALNGVPAAGAETSGPGLITGPIQLLFSDKLPYFSNFEGGFFLDALTFLFFLGDPTSGGLDPRTGAAALRSVAWGSFDGTTNAVVVYPQFGNLTLEDIRNEILNTGGTGQ